MHHLPFEAEHHPATVEVPRASLTTHSATRSNVPHLSVSVGLQMHFVGTCIRPLRGKDSLHCEISDIKRVPDWEHCIRESELFHQPEVCQHYDETRARTGREV